MEFVLAFTNNFENMIVDKGQAAQHLIEYISGISLKVSQNDPFAKINQERTSSLLLSKKLLCINIVTPILKYNLQNVSVGFKDSFEKISLITSLVIKDLKIEETTDNYWKINVITKVVTQTLDTLVTNKIDFSIEDVKNIILSFNSTFDSFYSKFDKPYESLSESLRLFYLQLTGFIFSEILIGNKLFINPKFSLNLVVENIINIYLEETEFLIDKCQTLEDNFTILKNLIFSTFPLIKKIWLAEEDKANNILYCLSESKRQKLIQKYTSSGGLPLDGFYESLKDNIKILDSSINQLMSI